MRMLPPVWPHACEKSVCVEKLNIDYMTYFDDMDDFNRLTERLYQTEVQLQNENLDTQFLRLQEALDGQRIGQQGFGGDSFIKNPGVIRTKHRVQNGYLFTSRKMQIINSRSFYTKRLGTSDQYDFGSFKSSNSTATVTSADGRPAASESRRSCRICTNGYEQFIPTKDADECFRDFALIVTNKTRMKHDGMVYQR